MTGTQARVGLDLLRNQKGWVPEKMLATGIIFNGNRLPQGARLSLSQVPCGNDNSGPIVIDKGSKRF